MRLAALALLVSSGLALAAPSPRTAGMGPRVSDGLALSVQLPGSLRSAARHETVQLGWVNTRVGAPRVGRRIETRDGAHFVLDLVAAVERVRSAPVRAPARRPASLARRQGAPAGVTARPARRGSVRVDPTPRPAGITAQGRVRVVQPRGYALYVRNDGPVLPTGVSVHVADGHSAVWSAGADVGLRIGAADTVVHRGQLGAPWPHQVSAHASHRSGGRVRVELVYTVVPE